MSQPNLNNVINAALVVGAVLSGLGLTARTKERNERPEVSDLAGMTEKRAAAKAEAAAPPAHPTHKKP